MAASACGHTNISSHDRPASDFHRLGESLLGSGHSVAAIRRVRARPAVFGRHSEADDRLPYIPVAPVAHTRRPAAGHCARHQLRPKGQHATSAASGRLPTTKTSSLACSSCEEPWHRLLSLRCRGITKMPATYDAWLRRAELTEKQLQKAGFGVARIWIRPVPFAAWCKERNVAPDQSARLTFAGDAVRDLPAWC